MIQIPAWVFFLSMPAFFSLVLVILYKKFNLKTNKKQGHELLMYVVSIAILLVLIVLDLAVLQSELISSLILYGPCMGCMFLVFYKATKKSVIFAETNRNMSLKVLNHTNSISASIQELYASVEEVTASAETISEKSNKISNMSEQTRHLIKIIKKTAEQTKLLSLNANIEAGRAGEHGYGFSVVANEFGKLSDNINDNTEGTTESVSESIDLIQELTHELESISATMEQQSMSLEEISGSIEELSLHANNLNKLL